MTYFVVIVAGLIELPILALLLHYAHKSTPDATGQEFRYVTPLTLGSYSTLALSFAGVCAAGLWALLPISFDQWSYGEAPLAIKLSATSLTLGAFFSGLFILGIYRMYELGKNPTEREENQQVRLSDWQLRLLLGFAFVGISGVAQGAYFLITALWGW